MLWISGILFLGLIYATFIHEHKRKKKKHLIGIPDSKFIGLEYIPGLDR